MSGILLKVNFSDRANPIVVIPKKHSSDLHICVDLKKTLNHVLDSDHCFTEDIFAYFSGQKFFRV